MASRMEMSIKNAFWSYFSMMITVFLQFISRTVFIYQLGENYLGLNGLFSNILGVLSFAELGIGTAINFSLYKPVAQQDVEKIKAYMYFYKWAYRVIALIVFILGMVLFPFLNYLVTDPGNVGDIRVYYLIYLFNTVTSYLVSYKFSIGKKMIVDDLIINLILIDFYMIGQRICLNNFKSAAGVFEEDKYVALLQAIVNLVVSIMLAKIIGVPGVYIGTLVQGTMCTILKPILTFNTLFEKKWILYFGDSIKYIGVLSIAYAMCMVAKKIVLVQITITNFAILVMIIAILPNVIFYIVFHKSKEFVYFKTYLWRCIKR